MLAIKSKIKDKISLFSPIIRNFLRLRLNVWIIKGEEKATKQEIKLLYMGCDLSRYYVEDLVFSNIIEERHIGKKWIWTTLRMARRNYIDCSLLIAETGDFLAKLFKRKQEFFIPCFIQGEARIDANLGGPFKTNKSLKNDLRKIRRHKLDYELTKEQAQFDNFYHNMYIPFAKKRYGKRAILENYYDVKKFFKIGELLLVKMGGVPIAATLIRYENNQAFLCALGVKDGNLDYMRLGAIAALYYYPINYLIERGFNRVNLGFTRPFLNDGVLIFKKKLGLKIVGTSGPGFLIKPLPGKAAVRGFLLNNPFVFKDSNHLYGAVFLLPEQIDGEKSVEKIFHNYYTDGISKLIIYVLNGTDSINQMSIPKELDSRITILNAGNMFGRLVYRKQQ